MSTLRGAAGSGAASTPLAPPPAGEDMSSSASPSEPPGLLVGLEVPQSLRGQEAPSHHFWTQSPTRSHVTGHESFEPGTWDRGRCLCCLLLSVGLRKQHLPTGGTGRINRTQPLPLRSGHGPGGPASPCLGDSALEEQAEMGLLVPALTKGSLEKPLVDAAARGPGRKQWRGGLGHRRGAGTGLRTVPGGLQWEGRRGQSCPEDDRGAGPCRAAGLQPDQPVLCGGRMRGATRQGPLPGSPRRPGGITCPSRSCSACRARQEPPGPPQPPLQGPTWQQGV